MIRKSINKFCKIVNNQIFRNLVLVGGITLLIKALGFYKETIVAANFGLSIALDTFYIAFLIPGFIQSVFLESFKSVFIPNYVAEMRVGNNISAFQGTAFLCTTLITLFLALVAYLFTDTYLEVFFGGHDESYYVLVKDQFIYLLPCIFFWGYSSLLNGLLNINDEFKYSTISGIFTPISIITALVFLRGSFGNLVLSIGTLAGAIVSFIYLLTVCQYKKILSLAIPQLKNKNAIIMFSQIPAKISSSFLTGINKVVDQFFAAQLVVGSLSALNYGLKIPAFFMGLLVIALSSVLLPKFSKLVIDDKEKAYRLFFKMIKYIFLVSSLIALVTIFLSDYIVELLFERKEFTSDDTVLVANIQKLFLIYTPFAITGMAIVNFLTSLNKNAVMAYASFIAVILNAVFDYILIKFYGVYGIAVCTTLVIILKNLFLFYLVLKSKKKDLASSG